MLDKARIEKGDDSGSEISDDKEKPFVNKHL